MKHILSVCAVLSTSTILAQDPQIEFELETPVVSRYVWRGLNVVDKPVYQPTLTASRGPWSLELFGNLESAADRACCTELDASFTFSTTQGDWNLDLGYSRYRFPMEPGTDTGEAFVVAALDHPLAPTIELNTDVERVGGAYGRLSACPVLFTKDDSELALDLGIGFGSRSHNDYYFENDKSGPVDATAVVTFSHGLGADSQLVVFGGISTLLDKSHVPGNGRRENVFFGAGVSLSF